jgi:3'(2'), 5'-bisphosphate nucleotidase
MRIMREEMLMRLREEAIAIARQAGKAIEGVTRLDVEAKRDGSPVTRADNASHRCILAALVELEPSFPILSEEGEPERIQRQNPPVFWLVDPLDGTKEFIQGRAEYTVNIALVEGDTPVLGVIHPPAQEQVFHAAEGLGSWRRSADGRDEPLRPGSERPPTAVVSRSHRSARVEALLARLGVVHTVQMGSSLKFCVVAWGGADLYARLGPTCLWDTGAGTVIAREAGCRVENLRGTPLTYRLSDGLKVDGFIVYYPPTCEVDVATALD